jgi:signal peptidase I
MARRDGGIEESFSPRKLVLIITEIILVVIIALSSVALVQLYWIAPIGIQGPSMEDTLYTGDTVYIQKNYKHISRGDVVVVYLPNDYNNYLWDMERYIGENDDTDRCPASRKKTFDDFIAAMPFFGKNKTNDDNSATKEDEYKLVIKRVVGVPGDRIRIIDGVLYVNNGPDSRAGLFNFRAEYPFDYDHTLGEGEYYILGDNRGISKDSSEYGPIKANWIYGKVIAAHTHNKFKTNL